MAHTNINERRMRVAELIEQGSISGSVRRQLAAEFKCSIAAIGADVIALTVRTAASIHVTAAMRRYITERDGHICQYCGVQREQMIIEHVIPAAKGGVAKPYNLVLACQSCNMQKRFKTMLPRNLDSITSDHPEWRARVSDFYPM